MIMYKTNPPKKPPMNPLLKVVILLAVYALGYAVGSYNQKNTLTESVFNNGADEPLGSGTEKIDSNYYYAADGTDTSGSDDLKFAVKYDISYSDLNKNERSFYDKIISTALNKDNTFITDKELHFTFNKKISEQEHINVRAVLHNNYPDIKFYTTRFPDSWIYYETQYLNGIPINRTYYFKIKYV